ncbi:MAG: hypothetical protein JWO86_7425 [Myxococcaceae bacterium]|nr:hypothetical protein [Myxococcaceae bacterium]
MTRGLENGEREMTLGHDGQTVAPDPGSLTAK